MAESYERIHRSNLVGMGVIPLQYQEGENASVLELSGEESFSIEMPPIDQLHPRQLIKISTDCGKEFKVLARFDTELELAYFKNGGILHYMIRKVLSK